MSDLTEKLFQKAREDCPESKAVYQHICWEAANLIGDLEQRIADLEHELGKVESQFFTCNQLYDEQAKQIEKLDDTRIEYIGMINKLVDEREELKKVLKVADEKMKRLEQYMDRVQNLIAFFHADIQVALCKDKK
jgi:septal ring factor EnvC (AmiA/AmiB activator)